MSIFSEETLRVNVRLEPADSDTTETFEEGQRWPELEGDLENVEEQEDASVSADTDDIPMEPDSSSWWNPPPPPEEYDGPADSTWWIVPEMSDDEDEETVPEN